MAAQPVPRQGHCERRRQCGNYNSRDRQTERRPPPVWALLLRRPGGCDGSSPALGARRPKGELFGRTFVPGDTARSSWIRKPPLRRDRGRTRASVRRHGLGIGGSPTASPIRPTGKSSERSSGRLLDHKSDSAGALAPGTSHAIGNHHRGRRSAPASHPSSCQSATLGRSVAAARWTTRRSRDWRVARLDLGFSSGPAFASARASAGSWVLSEQGNATNPLGASRRASASWEVGRSF